MAKENDLEIREKKIIKINNRKNLIIQKKH